jgi:hypothetical protein
MSQHMFPLEDLVIASGQTESNVLIAEGAIVAGVHDGTGYRDADSITIFAPDTLPESTALHVAEAVGGNFNALFRGGADVTIPAAKAITVELISWKAMKLVAAAVAAERRFKVNKGVWV